ncbi:hypothetical protein STEG23_035320 [Scotinomys teguina]
MARQLSSMQEIQRKRQDEEEREANELSMEKYVMELRKCSGWLFQLSLEVPPPLIFPMTVTPLGRDQDCSLKIREPDVPAPLVLDPGGWNKTAVVRLFFIFPGICTLSLII